LKTFLDRAVIDMLDSLARLPEHDAKRYLIKSELKKLELKIRKSGEIYVIDVNGELDLYNSYKLKELVNKMVGKKIQRFVINLQDVEYIDSSGIGALIYIHSTAKRLGIGFFISNVHGSVKKVIELTKLMNYFPIVSKVSNAVKQLEE